MCVSCFFEFSFCNAALDDWLYASLPLPLPLPLPPTVPPTVPPTSPSAPRLGSPLPYHLPCPCPLPHSHVTLPSDTRNLWTALLSADRLGTVSPSVRPSADCTRPPAARPRLWSIRYMCRWRYLPGVGDGARVLCGAEYYRSMLSYCSFLSAVYLRGYRVLVTVHPCQAVCSSLRGMKAHKHIAQQHDADRL